MKHAFAAILAVAVLGAGTAHAQVFGQMGGARPLEMNGRRAGVMLQMGEQTLGLLGELRLSFYPGVDFGFQGGISRVDVGIGRRSAVRLGADFRTRLVQNTYEMPLDLALGGAIGIETADDYTLLSVAPVLQTSRTIELAGRPFTPYGGVSLLFSRLDVHGENQTDLGIGLALGASWEIQRDVHLVGELQPHFNDEFNDNFSALLGVQTAF